MRVRQGKCKSERESNSAVVYGDAGKVKKQENLDKVKAEIKIAIQRENVSSS